MPYADPAIQRAAKRESARRARLRQREARCIEPEPLEDVEPGVEPRAQNVISQMQPIGPLLPADFRLLNMLSVLALLDHSVRCVDADQTTPPIQKGRAFAYIASTAARVTGYQELEERLTRIEEIENARQVERVL